MWMANKEKQPFFRGLRSDVIVAAVAMALFTNTSLSL